MSDNALALAAITGGAPQDAEYDAVYAAVTATERGRWFLSEFGSRNRHADTCSITAALARVEAALGGDAAAPPGAVSVRDLGAVAATIDRIGAAIQTERDAIAAAVARIADIIRELRERAVKTALCDALDAETREMAWGERAGDAAKLLHELNAEIGALIKAARTDEAPDGSPASSAPADDTTTLAEAAPVASRPAEDAGGGSEEDVSSPSDPLDLAWRDDKKLAAAAAALMASLGEDVRAPREVQSATADAVILQPHQVAEAADAEPTDRPGSSYIEPPDFLFAPPAQEPDRDVEVEASEQSGQAHPLLPATALPMDPADDPADLFEAMPESGAALSSAPASPTAIPAPRATPPVQLPTPQLRIAAGSAIRSSPRPAPSNPLAALRALSEEELIALFG